MKKKYLYTAFILSNTALAGSSYTINLDSDFIKTFSNLGYKVQVRQGCRLNSGSWTHNNSKEQSVVNDKSKYLLTTARCKKDPGQGNKTRDVQYIELKFNKSGKPTHSCKFNIQTSSSSVNRSYNVNMFNCDRTSFYANFLPSSANDNFSDAINISDEQISTMSPTTFLCNINNTPETQDIRPYKVENFLKYVDYYNTKSEYVKHAPAAQDLAGQDGYLQSYSQASFAGEDDLRDAPYYIRVKNYTLKNFPTKNAGFVDIQYWNFYGLNGSQFFRVGGNFVDNKNFVWREFAYHEGDWEHITVRVNATADKILGVFYAGHGGGHWVAGSDISYDNKHPVAYSACNSHASNDKKEIFNQESIAWKGANIGSVCGVWLKAIDEGSQSTIRWAPWETNNLVRIDDSNSAPSWMTYKGKYGPERNNSSLEIVGQSGKTAACLKSFGSFAPDTYKTASGPRSPKYQPKAWSNIE